MGAADLGTTVSLVGALVHLYLLAGLFYER
jgi:hypothetical protein